jgi:hypothetical protein
MVDVESIEFQDAMREIVYRALKGQAFIRDTADFERTVEKVLAAMEKIIDKLEESMITRSDPEFVELGEARRERETDG